MSSDEPKPLTSLAVPLGGNAGASETASRAETLIEKNGSEKQSTDETAEGARRSTDAGRPNSVKGEQTVSLEKNEKNKAFDLEKGARVGETAVVTEGGGEGDQDVVRPDADRYITGFRLFLVFVGLLLSIFLVALDQTIIATALPVIASKFNALDNLTWVVSAYFFTQSGLILFFGQLLTIVNTKYLYLFVITLFEVGSLFCAVAWNMNFLIFGRAVAGTGAAGIFISILTIIARVTRLEDRPLLFGAFGGVFAVSSVAGPLLGGAFTDHVSWRWCFYINLPFGALSIAAVLLFLKSTPTVDLPGNEGKSKLQKWLGLDWIGTVFSLGMIIPLMIALQWGGNIRAWNDRVIIVCFVVFAIMLPVFVTWQWRQGGRAIMPLSLFKRTTEIGCSLQAFFVMFNLTIATYYIPYYYQASRGRTPTQSGIDILPFMLTIILSAAGSGAVVNLTGRYIHFLRWGPLFTAIGAGLLYTIRLDTPNSKLIGFQIIFGLGVGVALQNSIIACQTEWADRDELIPQATSVVNFFQLLGGVLGIAIAGAVFSNQLTHNIHAYAPGLDPQVLAAIKEALSTIQTLPADIKQQVILAYIKSLNFVFIIGIPTSVLASLSSILIKNHSVKERGSGGMGVAA